MPAFRKDLQEFEESTVLVLAAAPWRAGRRIDGPNFVELAMGGTRG
jgi:hypothetical protein